MAMCWHVNFLFVMNYCHKLYLALFNFQDRTIKYQSVQYVECLESWMRKYPLSFWLYKVNTWSSYKRGLLPTHWSNKTKLKVNWKKNRTHHWNDGSKVKSIYWKTLLVPITHIKLLIPASNSSSRRSDTWPLQAPAHKLMWVSEHTDTHTHKHTKDKL